MHIIQIITIMGIRITSKNAKYPKGIKIASEIASYLFEEQYGEIEYMPESEKETLKKACKILQKSK